MAKDRRNKTRPTLDLDNDLSTQQPRRSGERTRVPDRSTRRTDTATPVRRTSTATPSRKRKKKKKKLSRAALVLICVIVLFVIVFLVFAAVLANYIFQAMFVTPVDKNDPITPHEYDVTPVGQQDQVAYYLFGILGEEETSDTAMLSVACHDKKQNTVNVLELPEATFIETSDAWAVDTLGAVFANPKKLDWCETCNKRVYAPEINEGETATHTVCGTQIKWKKGSAVGGLIDFVNDQLALPVDQYFLLTSESVTVLVDAVGGVDVELDSARTLNDHYYEAGVQTLSGAAAQDYVTEYDGTIEGDRVRRTRQRQVFGALLTRIYRLDAETMKEDVIEEVQDSAEAIRTEASVDTIASIVTELAAAGVKGTTVQLLPGEATVDSDGDSVYTAHKNELLNVINGAFLPYGAKITQADLLIPELVNLAPGETDQNTLDVYTVEQTGKLLVEEE